MMRAAPRRHRRSRTEMRTSPSPSTDSGKIECGTSDATIDWMPCVSSRPRTTLASMSECVRKMTTGEDGSARHRGLGRAIGLRASVVQPVDLDQDHRHVVVLRRAADERFASHAGSARAAPRVGRWPCSSTSRPRRASPKQSACVVHRLADAVGEEARTGRPAAAAGAPPRAAAEAFAAVDVQAQHHAVRRQHLGAAARRLAPGTRMSGVWPARA